jgi:hypothetical protein|uniref:hypothetical protein n=1 Tax=Altererythrobacter segetis TaxID=1104773 RepID=UPI00140DC1DC|nr:hypothetical protein [Altererythrobacter segetis]
MNQITKALCWAAAMLLLALGDRAGVLEHGTVVTLTTILPLLAWMSISGRTCCLPREA